MFSPRELQLEWCRKQVELAVELGMPLFLHERDVDSSKGRKLGSAADLQAILSDCKVEPKKVCIHCFTGNKEELKYYVSQGGRENWNTYQGESQGWQAIWQFDIGVVGRIPGGYFIGLTGFAAMKKRGRHIREMLESGDLPLQQLMLEMHVSNITML